MKDYPYTAKDLAEEFGVGINAMNKRLRDLGLGIGFGGRFGYRYSEDDRLVVLDSLRRGGAA